MDDAELLIAATLLNLKSNQHQNAVDNLQNLHEMSKSMNMRERFNFVMEHKKSLESIWNIIKGKNNMVLINGNRQHFRKAITSYLQPIVLNSNGIDAFIMRHVSECFLHFIQGITLFRENGDDVMAPNLGTPAYHRAASCGPELASLEYKNDNMSCLGVKQADELRRRKRNIWNCNLERLIYDAMFEKYFSEQNYRHRYQMIHVERELFETCFPLIELHIALVNVKWDNHMPVQLDLVYKKKWNATEYVMVKEVYKRRVNRNGLYELLVFCERLVTMPNGRKKLYTKTSSFLSTKDKWVAQHGAPPNFNDDPWKKITPKQTGKFVMKW